MTFSPKWDNIYRSNKQNSIWPWSDLVSYVRRYTNPSRVLELGCGAGANIPFFISLDVDYCGIDGSNVVITRLKKKFPEINLVVADFTQNIPFEGKFDLIVDRGGLTCNSISSIERCLGLSYDKLVSGGKFIGIDLVDINEEQVIKLFERFNILLLECKTINRKIPHDNYTYTSWNIVVEKLVL